MKLLLTIKDSPLTKEKTPTKRSAARAVLLDKEGLIPLLFVSKLNYHKLPGGGIEQGEDKFKALAREVYEETGCEAQVCGEVGEIVEFRSEWNLLQISYCYWGKITKKGTPKFTEEERQEGFQLLWVGLPEAISLIKNDNPDDYEGKFIVERDLKFLEAAKKLIKK